ncbi:MAG: hypothetical protein OXH19_06450 [Chloroflexi bacterium]|nr:hypothetical protein [Chloroflexota bacterium]MCY3588948.1 hypothetical protein [Chloroflexota bacterium]MCY3687214.1 hypothetical protein [Chloroflexota bacterium]MDE2707394.1 hypothetical protein [Chloroflexota bacterium]
MPRPSHLTTWPSLAELPSLYPDARNRINRGPYMYRAGKTWPLPSRVDTANRIAVLAVGSNAYPRQLSDKLSGTPADLQGIPTVPAILSDLDVAYCPVRSRNGYVPVTLTSRPGAVCLTWLQWLTLEQLNLISSTEGSRYALVGGSSLAQSAIIPAHLRRPAAIYAWWFDSLLRRDGFTVWLDVYRRGIEPDLDRLESKENELPSDWIEVPRTAEHHAISQEIMSEIC